MSLLVPKKDGLKSIYIDGKNFRLCVNISDGRNSVVENLNQRWKTLYYYFVYGDGGMIYPGTGNVPFYIKKGFQGIISQGTPVAQIIPFRQEKWKSKIEKDFLKNGQIMKESSLFSIFGWYKKNYWIKKEYQ